ncbi:MAG: glycosyltransferase family 4 protein [Dehalococcoidia bacterium]|nr:glycosyltransferase family 4 protein [Dehalococcoidia bacterium]MDZ4246743.1 glycosyltransferase family 4 protein [Dehalococcoidia bacterium]
MKIGLISPYDLSYPGGVSLHVSRLAHEFLKKGHSVRIIAPCSSPPADALKDLVIPQGYPIPVPSAGSIARISLSLRLSKPIRALMEREKFDVVHIHEPLTPTLPLTALRVSPAITVGTFHACHSKPRGYGIGKPILSHWFKRLHGKIAVSEAARKFVSRHFPGDYRVIPNGVDNTHFSPVGPYIDYMKDGKINLLFVGRLEKRKGLKTLLKAFQLLKKEYPETRLIVVGPGERAINKYQNMAQKENIPDVIFTGYIPSQELPQYYRSADIFCAPATGEESFGMVLLEAMSCGKPVVASNIEGYAGVLSDGLEGFLVPPKNIESLKDAMSRLTGDRKLREEMGERGRIKAQGYSWENVAGKILKYYGELRYPDTYLYGKELTFQPPVTAFPVE